MIPITISLTRYAEPDAELIATLRALARQVAINAVILVLDQKESGAVKNICVSLSSAAIGFEYQPIPANSLSYARNRAIELCQTNILLFLDTDALPSPDWAFQLSQPLLMGQAAVAGGRVVPGWSTPIGFLQRSKWVQEQYSMLDLGSETRLVTKIVGASFAIDKLQLQADAWFDENLGRRNGKLIGGEETDLCARALARAHKVIYVGSAEVLHQVAPERMTSSWLFKRIYYGGYSRALRGGRPAPSHTPAAFLLDDYIALACLVPIYALGYFAGVFSKQLRKPSPRS